MQSGCERDVVKPCADVVTKEREEAEAPSGAYVRWTTRLSVPIESALLVHEERAHHAASVRSSEIDAIAD